MAVRPTFHPPAIFAKQAANIDRISGGRLSLNVVSSWWATEAKKYGVQFDVHDDRYARTAEWLAIVEQHGFDRRFSDPQSVEHSQIVPLIHRRTGLPVDIVLAGPGLEDELLDRAVPRRIDDVEVPVIEAAIFWAAVRAAPIGRSSTAIR